MFDLKTYIWIFHEDNEDLFARAWLDGWKVEEKKYRIKFGEDRYAQSFSPTNIDSLLVDKELACEFTEKEIKDINPNYWPFAEEVK